LSDWFVIQQNTRRDVHAAFALLAEYTDQVVTSPVVLHVRWHQQFGLPIGSISRDDASVFESIDRVVFDRQELLDNGLTIRRGGRVYFVDRDFVLTLDNKQLNSGPVTEVWTVSP
jgi:hypothetical protein